MFMTRLLLLQNSIFILKKRKSELRAVHVTIYILGGDLTKTFVSVTHRYCRISPKISKRPQVSLSTLDRTLVVIQ